MYQNEAAGNCSGEDRTDPCGFHRLECHQWHQKQTEKTLIMEMTKRDGSSETSRKGIADIFADFYAELYASSQAAAIGAVGGIDQSIPSFSEAELTTALEKLKAGKGCDSRGIVAEMLKHGGRQLRRVLLNTMNEAIAPGASFPTEWKENGISVMFKSGDPTVAKNYRPISVLPILYKLFAVLLSNRLEPILDIRQCKDQAGFRKKFSTLDQIFAAAMIIEKSKEWQCELWLGAIDFVKAFDSVELGSLWSALREQDVPVAYVQLLERLYSGQTGVVVTDKRSKTFDIRRGTKQGDPLSTLLFNCLLESVFAKLKPKWLKRRIGLDVSAAATEYLTNLRFADDVLLFATCRSHMERMMSDIQAEAALHGLQLHPEKTKVLTNARQQLRASIHHGPSSIEVLGPSGAVKYLGRKLAIQDCHDDEFNNRIAAAWASFTARKGELVNKRYPFKARLRLFNATVGATVLYGSEALTLRQDQRRRLRTT